MDNEQVIETTAQETTTEAPSAVETKTEEPGYKAPSEEEFKKALQSASSKAKYSLMQELGITSVEDFKAKTQKYNESISEVEKLKEKQTEYEREVNSLKTNLTIEKLGVLDEYKDDLITLANAKVTDSVDFKSAAEEILNKNPNWKKGTNAPKVGTEKNEVKHTVESELNKKYPWIR